MSDLRTQMRYLNPYDMHKLLINEYVLRRPGDTRQLKRDTSKDKTDFDVLKENHKFLWDEEQIPDSWELQFAKKYYDKLFKEYCIADLSLYKENKIALRWRIEREVVTGKGQFICGNKKCDEKNDLRTWEVNFSYKEKDEQKNALIKIRLCPDCSYKLNYHTKKREVKRLKRKSKTIVFDKKHKKHNSESEEPSTSTHKPSPDQQVSIHVPNLECSKETTWDQHKPEEIKSREEEMEDYLQDLLL
ncbi:protein FRA10AC1 homolog [Aethina tumida]|uniref:protein FRA10AC1 homolog n=1 Tax=Aethina tumida TaxID=116153 RepID=UPI00096B2412|nr:protein FRA10AC1 homolog [Aethina tumida]